MITTGLKETGDLISWKLNDITQFLLFHPSHV